MNYRDIPPAGAKISVLGMGCMRLPLLKAADGSVNNNLVDEEATSLLVQKATDAGVNYFDTAYPYHGGNSEIAMGKALKPLKRSDFYLTTKLPMWLVKSPDDVERFLTEQLERLQMDYVDFYFFHGLNRDTWQLVKELKLIEPMERMRAKGLIKNIGFSFHDGVSVFKEIVDGYDQWAISQIQLNYMDANYQAGLEGLRYAGKKGIGVVAMEPLKAGTLVRQEDMPRDVKKLFADSPVQQDYVSWALRWLFHQPELTTAICGMTTPEQLETDLKAVDGVVPGCMSEQELDTIEQVYRAYSKLTRVRCSACAYCMPCPCGVDIPNVFRSYNYATLYINANEPGNDICLQYLNTVNNGHGADQCVKCGRCEKRCPQHIEIIQELASAHEYLMGQCSELGVR